MHDAGIDGHMQYVCDGIVAGHSVAVQIKTSVSYLKEAPKDFL